MSLRAASRLAPAALLVLAALGCGSDKATEPPPASQLPANDTPERTIQRFILVYEQKRVAEFEQLFTGDFTFEFSNATDPDLVQKYSGGWFREDERIAARNLFLGGTNSDGDFPSGASTAWLLAAGTHC